MKRVNLMFVSMVALMLCIHTGCPKNNEEQRIEKCMSTDIIRMGEYVLVNDDSQHSGYAQCIFEDPGEQTFGWTWKGLSPAPENSQETTSAYIFYGRRMSETPVQLTRFESTTPNLPVQIDSITSLVIDYDVIVSTTSQCNLSFRANAVHLYSFYSASISIAIIVDAARPPSDADFQTRVTIDGDEYDYYASVFYGSNTLSSSEYHYFVKSIPTHTGILRLHKFLDFLENEGYTSLLERIDYIEFVQEMWGGESGSTTIHKYSIDIASRAQ